MGYFEKAVEINPNNASACYNLGNTLQKFGANQKAKFYYERALHHSPNNVNFCSGYGKLLLALNKHTLGLRYISKALGVIVFEKSGLKII